MNRGKDAENVTTTVIATPNGVDEPEPPVAEQQNTVTSPNATEPNSSALAKFNGTVLMVFFNDFSY